MLSWHQTKPGGKVACLAEGLGWRSQNRNGRGNQRPDARTGHETAHHFALSRAAIDLGVQNSDLPVKLVGLGEGPDDLAPFVPEAFVDAIVG